MHVYMKNKTYLHNVVTNDKFILPEFVIEPVEPTAFIFLAWPLGHGPECVRHKTQNVNPMYKI